MTTKVISVDAPASGARGGFALFRRGSWLVLLGLGKAISLCLYVLCVIPILLLKLFASRLGNLGQSEDGWTASNSKTVPERIENIHRWDPETYKDLYGRYPDRFHDEK